MKIAIVHYHLGPGGVSKVIATTSHWLTGSGVRHVILVDSPPECSEADLPVRMVPGLGYRPLASADDLLARLQAGACTALGGPPDLWHFHNHSLGKNPWLPEVVARLAEEGERMVLQIHDLAEDGRPGNYQEIADCGKLYPASGRIRYVFLNSRDRAVFREAGLDENSSVLLGNPVSPPVRHARDDSLPPVLFAPVRGIRRKNLGEMVFLSALAPAGARFAVSRAPVARDALAIHDTWRKFAKLQRLPIEFDVVDHVAPAPGVSPAFDSWLSHASHIITTSVAEGFGLPFLEAAGLGKPLLGRNIAHLTADHARHGILTGDLYDKILVPTEWVDLAILRDHLHTTLERNHRAYRRPLPRERADATFSTLIHRGWLDFGNLPEPLQQGVIERLADPACRGIPLVEQNCETRSAEEWLAAAIDNRSPTASPAQLAPYSPAEVGTALLSVYSELMDHPLSAVRFLPPAGILDAYLTPKSFHFLLSTPPPASGSRLPFRAVIFDIYGTLLMAPPGRVEPDPAADLLLRDVLRQFGHPPPERPSADLHAAVLRHHAAAGVPFPEIDLRVLWREILGLDPYEEVTDMVIALESAWHPARPMPGAAAFVRQLARAGLSLGLLSNAQCNTLRSLGNLKDLFAPELTLLSYRHGIAKPSPELFEMLTERLAARGIAPSETLFIGNDPLTDIVPAAACGMRTALFTGHPDSLRPGACFPDFEIRDWHSGIIGYAR
jgi:FMN phosphatase YigB (HAD superfamily)